MATFVDPVADAAEAYEGLRGLAHATRTFEDPADTYRVLGEVSGSVRLLRQVLDQLSRAHADHRDIAFTDDRVPAEAVALAAADELHQAADGLDEVADQVMRAHEASGRTAWHTHTNPEPVGLTPSGGHRLSGVLGRCGGVVLEGGYVNPTWPLADGQKWTHLARAQRQIRMRSCALHRTAGCRTGCPRGRPR